MTTIETEVFQPQQFISVLLDNAAKPEILRHALIAYTDAVLESAPGNCTCHSAAQAAAALQLAEASDSTVTPHDVQVIRVNAQSVRDALGNNTSDPGKVAA